MIRAAALILAIAPAAALAGPSREGTLDTVRVESTGHEAARVLYLNRCKGGCKIVKAGINDARTHMSSIPRGPDGMEFTLSEYAYGDAEWDALMKCMREVYSPYGLTITDVEPAAGVAYNEGIIAGTDRELGLSDLGGVAPTTGDCTPNNYVASFSFANGYGPNATLDVCWTAAQETAHAFGLVDHAYAFGDGRSACSDPMTYRSDCGGQKFFRNEAAICGEFQAKPCSCASPNSHLKLLSVLGPGTPLTAAPALAVTSPAAGAQIPPRTTVIANASAQRGVKVVELWLNGYKWAEAKGAAFGPSGQPPSDYPLIIPADVPDGIIDIVVKAKDDIEATTTSAPLTVTKGEPCATEATCAPGQRCDAGRCLWDPPVGELGEACTYPQYCLAGLCQGTSSELRCTQECIVGVGDSCPDGFRCLASSATKGICWPGSGDDGWCSATRGAAGQSVLIAIGLAIALRRRRR
jgi:hypothetical protein